MTQAVKGWSCWSCWSYKAIKYAFEANPTNFDPDYNISTYRLLNEVCNINFNEDHIIEYMNTLYEKRYISFVGACPKTAPSQGYTICKYFNWIGMQGSIGDKNNSRKHVHMFLSKAHFYNLSRFRLGAWN